MAEDTTQPDETDVAYWKARLDESDKWAADYQSRCRNIVRLYNRQAQVVALQGDPDASATTGRNTYAILWSNIQTLGPAVYAHDPQAVVTRRYKDADQLGRVVAEILERSLSYSMDQYEFSDHLRLARDDYLLLGRGQAFVRFIPHASVEADTEAKDVDDNGDSITDAAQTPEPIPYAEVVCDHIAFDDWGMEPTKSWDGTRYVWKRAFMSRGELVERFGSEGAKVPLDWTPERETTTNNEQYENRKCAAIYEVWDKRTKTVYWLSRSHAKLLDKRPPDVAYKAFFPCPRPLTGTLAPDSYLPIPDYAYYQDQAAELNRLTARIGVLIDGLKLVGFYAGEQGQDLQNLFKTASGTLIPLASMAAFQDKGGMKGIIEWMPLEQVAATLKECFEARRQILEDIWQITGIADIMRGMSDPRATATAESLKGQWGSLRVRDKQKEMARFARDILRLQAEVIASKFPADTLKAMTDMKLLDTNEQKQAILATIEQNKALEQAGQQPMQPGMPPPQKPVPVPPEAQAMVGKPTWEEVEGLLRNSAMRSFRVDVETDSTIEADEQQDKAQRIEFLTTIGQLMGAALPVLQSAPQLAPLFKESILFAVRSFHVGQSMEDVIEQTFDSLAQNPPKVPGKGDTSDPQAGQVAALTLQTEQVKQQGAANVQQLKLVQQQQEMPIKQAELQLAQQDQQIKIAALQRDPDPQSVSNG